MSKAKKCKIGFPCGKSCINKLRKCWNNLPKEGANRQFETFSQFVNRLVGTGSATESAIKNDTPATKAKFNINQTLTEDKLISKREDISVYDAGDVVIKVGEISPNEVKQLKLLEELGFPHAQKVVAEGENRLALSKAPGDTVENQIDTLDDEDKKIIIDAVADLQKTGMSHNNLFLDNIMYDKESKKVTITNFDLALQSKELTPLAMKLMVKDAISVRKVITEESAEKIEKINSMLGSEKTDRIDIIKDNDKFKAMQEDKALFDDLMKELSTYTPADSKDKNIAKEEETVDKNIAKEEETVEKEKAKEVKVKEVPNDGKFDINQELTEDKFIAKGFFGSVYDFGDVVVKEGEVTDSEVANLKRLEELGYSHAPKVVAEGEKRLALSKAPGDTVENQIKDLKKEDHIRIMGALADLHALGMVHGDLHLGNIMYDKESKKVTMIDFGNSTYNEGESLSPNVMRGMVKDAIRARSMMGIDKRQKIENINDLMGSEKTDGFDRIRNMETLQEDRDRFDMLMNEFYDVQ